jgi:hypothetical protein
MNIVKVLENLLGLSSNRHNRRLISSHALDQVGHTSGQQQHGHWRLGQEQLLKSIGWADAG